MSGIKSTHKRKWLETLTSLFCPTYILLLELLAKGTSCGLAYEPQLDISIERKGSVKVPPVERPQLPGCWQCPVHHCSLQTHCLWWIGSLSCCQQLDEWWRWCQGVSLWPRQPMPCSCWSGHQTLHNYKRLRHKHQWFLACVSIQGLHVSSQYCFERSFWTDALLRILLNALSMSADGDISKSALQCLGNTIPFKRRQIIRTTTFWRHQIDFRRSIDAAS